MNFDHRPAHRVNQNHPLLFNVLVAYEDFATGHYALNVFNRLFPGSSQFPDFSTRNVWKFDLLEIAKFRSLAAEEAANADVIIISAHAAVALPVAVKRWLDMWIDERPHDPGAFVVLLSRTAKRVASDLRIETYLEACARKAGMDFFIQREDLRHNRREPAGTNIDANLARSAAPGKIITGVRWRAEYN